MAHATSSLTHDQNREKICLLCFTKPKESNRRKIQDGPILTRIQTFFMQNYNPNIQYMPNGICTRCAGLLNAIEKAKENCKKLKCSCIGNNHNNGDKESLKLPDPVDFSALEIPTITRNNTIECSCSICKIAREYVGNIGNRFGGRSKVDHHKLGVPTETKKIKAALPIKVCGNCKMVIGRGISHPKPCKVSDSVKNVMEGVYSYIFLHLFS